MAYHFFEAYARIDCNLADRLDGDAKKRHLKAYEDLMFLLTERKPFVEHYFCAQISDELFSELCEALYCEGITPEISASVNKEIRHPYSLGCRFSEDELMILYNCMVAHNVFEDLTFEKLKEFFKGQLSKSIKCVHSARFAYIMYHLSAVGLITYQYQKEIGKCGHIIAPRTQEAMTAKSMKSAVHMAHVNDEDDMTPWKYTINHELNRLFSMKGIDKKMK